MTHPLSLRQLGLIAVAMLDGDPRSTVADIADRVGISESTIYRYWPETPPGLRPLQRSTRLSRACGVVYARITEPAVFCELFTATRARLPTLHERTMYRALRKLVDDGRVTRTGPRGHAVYARREA